MFDTKFRQILTSHLTRTPAMQVQDVYKLLHQSVLGSEHAVHDEQAARDGLERELAEMGDGPDDPLFDPLPPDGHMLRVHLRPFHQTGMNPETLLRAYIQTANEWHGSPEKLKEYGLAAAQLVKAETGFIRLAETKAFFAKMETQDFPAIHHSEIYKLLYRPSYWVVASQFMKER